MARILVADDNVLTLEFFAESISHCGHVVDVANDGMQTCLMASAHHYELMIIDSRMPRRSGLEALRAIRAGNGPSRGSTAIASTAESGIDGKELLEAGFVEVLFKPIAADALGVLLDSHLSATAASNQVLDDAMALAKSGGDPGIMIRLRQLLALELDALPAEIGACQASNDAQALGDRLHRLAASAGFCGATRLARATQELHHALDVQDGWPNAAIRQLLRASAETIAELD